MKKLILFGALGVLGLGLLLAALLLALALTAEPLPSTAEALATLPPQEREALAQLGAAAGFDPDALRNIGSYDGDIFDHELNRRAIVVRDGHLVGLSLRDTPFSAPPDLSALFALEALDLRGSGLSAWPDLSALSRLQQANLSQQPLPDADAAKLPPNLRRLQLAATQVSDTEALSGLTQLRELDLSDTPVAGFEPLLGLKLDTLNLAGSRVATLPARVPSAGDWSVDLDRTPLLNPPGYTREWPFEGWIISTTDAGDVATGSVGKDRVEVSGNAADTDQPRAVRLPRGTDPNAPPVLLEVTCSGGQARIWLEEPPDFFPSVWMKQGKVKGFGLLRGRGYLSQTLSAGETVRLRGSLFLTTHDRIYEMVPEHRSESRKPPDWADYSFYLEPLAGSTVSGLSFKVVAAP